MLEVTINELPRQLSNFEAVEQCYQEQIRFLISRVSEEISVIVRCEKQIVPYLQSVIKRRLASNGKTLAIIDGRDPEGEQGNRSRLTTTVNMLKNLLNNTEANKVFLLPYLDIITSVSQGALTTEAREIMTIIHENPMLTLIAFEDPNFPFPELIEQAFPARCEMLGIPRNKISLLITENEAKKFSKDNLNLMSIFKYVSGLNPIRFREIMGIFGKKADFNPNMPEMLQAYLKELRDYTACAGASLSEIQLDKDIAGYDYVKTKIKENVLNIMLKSAKLTDENEIKQLESIIPRGLIFYGPPGTGKTLFAKGIAEAMNAAIYIVNGPELKSKWVGEGEANIRQLFARARATAPSVIVFDELDSIAGARSGNTSDGAGQAAHSMVNQLLTEMDGFKNEQTVLVIGTTNFLASLDIAFLRPGRFEYQIEIPYPKWEDRKKILELYNKKFGTQISEAGIERLAGWTGRNTATGTPHTGDHLSALIKALKRYLINNQKSAADEATFEEWLESITPKNVLSEFEANIVATHEAGHALLFYKYKRNSELTRITIESSGSDSLGCVESTFKKSNLYTQSFLQSEIGISLGGYSSEKLLLGEVSSGASNDLKVATDIATDMASVFGMIGVPRSFATNDFSVNPYFLNQLSPYVNNIISEIFKEVTAFLDTNKETLQALISELLSKRTLTFEEIENICKNTVICE
jgi:cell division protease FtsH